MQWYKATLVYEGNHQIKDINYEAAHELTATLDHVRLALTIAAKYNFEIHSMDYSMAFFKVDLEEEIYMYAPQGFIPLLQNGSE